MRNMSKKFSIYKIKEIGLLKFFSKHKSIIIPSLFILSYLIFSFLIDSTSQSLVAHDEGLYARRSRLLQESSNWFSPPFASAHHKTLGSYWLIALSLKLFGKSELALRLPSILSSFICLITTYLITLKISNKKSAFLAVFSLSSMPLWIQYSRYASPDLPFVLCILLFILFFLNFINTPEYTYKFIYIFFSGLFISVAFFIRSYMTFVPLIGLAPFLIYNLIRQKKIYIIFFTLGIVIGFIPTFLNLYYSYSIYGMSAIKLLFDFAKEKAIGGFSFTNTLLIPVNYIYLSFPIGLLFLLLFVFTKSNTRIKYPLLIYLYPLLSITILLCMSKTYLHYYIFLLPQLSILFAVKLNSFSFKFSYSKIVIRYILFSFMVLMSAIIILVPFYNKEFLTEYSSRKLLFLYIASFSLIFSYLFCLRYLFDTRKIKYNLLNLFYNIVIPQSYIIILLYNFGIIGNPNFKLKSFLNDEDVSTIVNANTIYLYNVDSKINTLLSYYLPSSINIKSSDEIFMYNYVITSDRDFFRNVDTDSVFRSIKKFDNHFLMVNKFK